MRFKEVSTLRYRQVQKQVYEAKIIAHAFGIRINVKDLEVNGIKTAVHLTFIQDENNKALLWWTPTNGSWKTVNGDHGTLEDTEHIVRLADMVKDR